MQRRPVKQIKETVAVAENSNESPTNEHLTNAALQLIKEAQSIPPMKYLEAIKSEKADMFLNKKLGYCKTLFLNQVFPAV